MGRMVKGHKAVGEIVEAVGKLLARFCDQGKTCRLRGWSAQIGVAVLYSQARNGIIRFSLITGDDLRIDVDYDINKTSRDYVDAMVEGVAEELDKRRRQEREESRIILMPEAVND